VKVLIFFGCGELGAANTDSRLSQWWFENRHTGR